RSMDNLPRLYQKYVGHDNNRDSYIANQPETAAMNRILFVEWIPQIMYNHHQTGPQGAMVFVPPFRDPFNYNFDPLVVTGIDLVGAAMHSRLIAEGKAGSTMRGGSNYSTWFNGGLRTTVYFHNQIGLLTEMKGTPTPMDIVLVPERQLPSTETPMPIPPQKWHFRQSIEYSLSLDRAVLDIASRYRETFLFNIYRMGKNSIERGSRDTWTIHPQRIQALIDRYAKDNPKSVPRIAGPRGHDPVPAKYFDVLRDPAFRDARGYIIPADQPDFLTATKFVNALLKAGVTVHRASSPFQAAGHAYPAGSYIVKAAQAFRPHVRDMFEPQDHPNDIPYPGGPPKPPYDATGWTLAYQMGVRFDRVFDAVDGPFEPVPALITPAPGTVAPGKVAAYLLSHEVNDAFVATGRLLAAKEDVYWLTAPFVAGAKTYPAGTICITARPTTRPILDKLAADLGVSFDGTTVRPAGPALKLRAVRIGLWDRYGGSMPSGWIRWMFEQAFPTSFEVVYPPALDAGNLAGRFDVLILPDDAIPERDAAADGPQGPALANIPAEYRDRIGQVTIARTMPQLRRFVEDGGTLIAIGNSAAVAHQLGLPVRDALVERLPDGTERKLGPERYYVPGSILHVAIDPSNPIAYGLPPALDVFFDNNPVFRLDPDATLRGVRPLAWFDTPQPLRSGWAWGQAYLDGGVAAFEAPLGKGRVMCFGPEITFRGQPHGTFKFLFNGIYRGTATPTTLGSPR
ncbi:MAG: peptidase, partial [Planctomycetes bacterium]|nr:peptidase [Planctomycetota bacterium]